MLRGKVAIITGGASGIGLATVQEFCQQGAQVVVADVDEVNGQRLVSSMNVASSATAGASPQAVFVKADVSSGSDCQQIVDAAMQTYGRIDVLFNNAGIQVRV